jgi:hypothetical protein
LAAGNPQRRLQQPNDRRSGQRLASARLADYSEYLARRDVEADIIYCDEHAAAGRHLDPQLLDPE